MYKSEKVQYFEIWGEECDLHLVELHLTGEDIPSETSENLI